MATKSVITKIRRKKMAEASHTTGTVAKITHIALGSGGVNADGTVIVPLAENVALKKEVVRKPYTSSTKTSDTSYEYTIKLEEDELVGTFISEMALIDEDGDVYLSTDVGVMCMNLNNYEVSIRSYRMQMKSIELDNVKYIVDSGEDIRIASGVQKIEIFPEIINYSVNVPYVSVYLEGYDDKPRVMPQSELSGIIYTGLPIGTYTFHLSVLDSKGQNPIVENTYTII